MDVLNSIAAMLSAPFITALVFGPFFMPNLLFAFSKQNKARNGFIALALTFGLVVAAVVFIDGPSAMIVVGLFPLWVITAVALCAQVVSAKGRSKT